jgi:pimeloyl-ACP methyl ester carboxylesterase
VEEYARVVHEIVIGELGLKQPIIAGHSLGGAIALTMALEYGTELGGLILIVTGARLRVLPELLATAQTSPQRASLQLKTMAMAPTTPVTMPTELMDEQAKPGANVVYRDLAACNSFDCLGRLGEIRLPTLIICGAEDRLTPVKYSQYLHEHIAGSTLRVIPGAGHYVFREQPEAVNSVIEEWLRQQ